MGDDQIIAHVPPPRYADADHRRMTRWYRQKGTSLSTADRDLRDPAATCIETEEELEAVHRLIAAGKPIPLQTAPGSKQPKR